MGYESLKLELIEWLMKLGDDETINYLKIVKESSSSNDWWDDLTEDQKAGIERGLRDVDSGNVIPHDQVKKQYGL